MRGAARGARARARGPRRRRAEPQLLAAACRGGRSAAAARSGAARAARRLTRAHALLRVAFKPASNSTLSSSSPLAVALLSLVLAQLLKVGTHYYTDRRLDWRRCIGSGGMPSSHASTVTSVAVSVGLHDGFGSHTFAVAMVLALVVMYDAMNVRLQAGKQAGILNQILVELPDDHPAQTKERQPLKELLGHTPTQVVAGALMGVFTAYVMYARGLANGGV